jgi:drug/metabolite transporter (DMT)-like permease
MLVAMALMWSPSFLFIKLGLDGFAPVTLAMLRLAIAAVVMYTIMRARGLRLPKSLESWKYIFLMSMFANAIPFVLFPLGEMYADSGAASVMNASTPIFTVVFAHWLIAEEKMRPIKMIGIALGFFGIVLMFLPAIMEVSYDYSTAWGLAAFAGAAMCYGASNIVAKKKLVALEPLSVSTSQFIISSSVLALVAVVFESPFSSPAGAVPVYSLLALAIIGTVLPYLIYYKLIARTSATYVSYVTFVMPPLGLLLGIVILDENPTWHSFAGCLMILLSVLILNNITERSSARKKQILN